MENNIYQNNIQAGSNNLPVSSNPTSNSTNNIVSSPSKDCNFVEKYRIRRLDQFIGNQNAIDTIKGELASGLIQNVQILLGDPSTGKSSAAFIKAKYINCQNPIDIGVPCEQCISCTSAAVDGNPDIILINAGSRNGIDTAKWLSEKLKNNTPVYNKKVVILEEWHKMTEAAQTAYLVLMENPTMSASTAKASNYAFIMPTTEDPRLVASNAILSRAAIVEFEPIPKGLLIQRLGEICNLEGITFDQESLEILYKHSNGAMRDCLKNLQMLAGRFNFNLTADSVAGFFNSSRSTISKDLFYSIHSLNPVKTRTFIEQYCNNANLKEVDFNDLGNLFLEACNNATPFMLDIYTRCLKIIRDNRITFLKDPSKKSAENLIITCNEIISLLRDNLGLAISHLVREVNFDLGNLLLNLNPNIKLVNGDVVFTIDPPNIGLTDLSNKLNHPKVRSVFDYFGVRDFEFNNVARDICFKIANDYDKFFGEALISLNPSTQVINGESLFIIDPPKNDLLGLLQKFNSEEARTIFNYFGISNYNFRNIGNDLCAQIANIGDNSFANTLFGLNPTTVFKDNKIVLVIDLPDRNPNNPIERNTFESLLLNQHITNVFISNGVSEFLYRQ